jgi:ribose transport system permease protein
MSNNLGPLPGGSVFIMAALLLWFGVSRTSFYDQLYAVGDNEVGAFTSGIAVQRVRLITYILSAVMAAIAALALTSFLDAASATIGPTLTLTALAGAALGGTSLRGGRGGVFGGLVGGTAIYLIQNVLSVLGVASYWITFTFGALLLVAIAVNAVVAQAAHSSVGST